MLFVLGVAADGQIAVLAHSRMRLLVVFAWLLTLVDTLEAGRAYAAYGGIYISSALLWLWPAAGVRPDRWDLGGAALCLAGACVIFFGPHRA